MSLQNTNLTKKQLNRWLHEHIYKMRKAGFKPTKSLIAETLGISKSSLSQYTNPSNDKKAPWEFQCKFCSMLGRSMEELHPEIADLDQRYHHALSLGTTA